MGNVNLIAVLLGILGWGMTGYFAYRIYKKKTVKISIWKVIVILFVGVFSFSFNWRMSETTIKLAILPLGVWFLFWLRGRTEQWQIYRHFAWLGFFANYIFLATTLAYIPLYHFIYPENQVDVYISNIERASIISTFPTAQNLTLDKKSLQEQLPKMMEESIHSMEWFHESEEETDKKSERFPYQLIGSTPKFGSGLNVIVYVENEGKGLLISTPEKQHYFRSDESILKGGQ
ncbi:hypothetical protein [Neobacillus sp. SAB-20_R2A]|uniref:hypothetical protein n=1 Tax=Neobacillus sp. SAB-20_R2A TaxID=3120519 RepID=UPI003C6E9D31